MVSSPTCTWSWVSQPRRVRMRVRNGRPCELPEARELMGGRKGASYPDTGEGTPELRQSRASGKPQSLGVPPSATCWRAGLSGRGLWWHRHPRGYGHPGMDLHDFDRQAPEFLLIDPDNPLVPARCLEDQVVELECEWYEGRRSTNLARCVASDYLARGFDVLGLAVERQLNFELVPVERLAVLHPQD